LIPRALPWSTLPIPAQANLLDRPAPAGGRILPQLDALRGIAILAVFVQHLGDRFGSLWEGGARALGPAAPWVLTALHHAWWGVDLFFVLSGFSLSLGFLSAFDAGGPPPDARTFLIRRAARILPGFFAALAVVIALRPEVARAPGFAAALTAHAALLQGYLSPGGIVLIGAAWSLTTEAHFYILLLLIARPLLARRAYLLGLGMVALSWAARAALHVAFVEPGVGGGLFELTQRRLIVSRLDQFVLGMLVACAYVDLQRAGLGARAARVAPVALGAAGAALVVAFRLEGEVFLQHDGFWAYPLMSLATAALVLAACLAGERTTRWIAPAPLRLLGVVSYGIFLLHQLLLGLAGALVPGEPTWWRLGFTAALGLAASALAGAASWVLVEQPFMTWISRLQRARHAARRDCPPGAEVEQSGA